MSKLEDLVPPLELCKRIPEGAFADSALVHARIFTGHIVVVPREAAIENDWDILCSAPTLAEIMEALPKNVEYRWYEGKFCPCHPKHDPVEFADKNPPTAALKLWLELKRSGITNGDTEKKVIGVFRNGAKLFSLINCAGIPFYTIEENGIEYCAAEIKDGEPKRLIRAYEKMRHTKLRGQ